MTDEEWDEYMMRMEERFTLKIPMGMNIGKNMTIKVI